MDGKDSNRKIITLNTFEQELEQNKSKSEISSESEKFSIISEEEYDDGLKNIEFDALEDNYFEIKYKKFLKVFKEKESIEKVIKMNKIINELVEEDENKDEILEQNALDLLKNHQSKIENLTFNWENEYIDLGNIHSMLKFFNNLPEGNYFLFLDVKVITNIFHVKCFENYFKKPLFYHEENKDIYDKVRNFHSDLLSLFNRLYIKSLMMKRPVIEAEFIMSIDPFMRNEIRRNNQVFFKENFPLENFDFFEFIINIIKAFDVTGNLRWEIESTPIVVPLFELIKDYFEFGLISIDNCNEILRFIYLICESLSSKEKEIQKESIDEKRKTVIKLPIWSKMYDNFLKCRENISSILIHIITIYCDQAFENTEIQFLNLKKKKTFFKQFIFKKKAVFSYFSYTLLEYLSEKIILNNEEIKSNFLKENLTLIYDFIGDIQNDFFSCSLELINEKNFEYYALKLKNIFHIENFKTHQDANLIFEKINTWIDKTDFSVNLYITGALKKLLTSIEDIIIVNKNNLLFSYELTRLNIPSLLLYILDFFDDGRSIEFDLIFRFVKIFKIILKKNYIAQGILFKTKTKDHFISIVKKRFFAFLIFKEIFDNDFTLIYLSTKLFFQNLEIYKSFVKNILTLIKNVKESKRSKQYIMGFYFFIQYLFNLLDIHLIKIKRRKRYDFILSNELYTLFTSIINYFIYINKLPEPFSKNIKLISECENFLIDDYPEIKKVMKKTSAQTLLTQLVFQIYKLYSKSVYRVYSGKLYGKIHLRLESFLRKLNDMAFTFPDSILLRLEFVKLYEKFRVFNQNHLITQRLRYNAEKEDQLGEFYFPKNIRDIKAFIINEFEWFEKYKNYHKDNKFAYKNMVKYLIKGFLLLIYKYFKGVLNHLSIRIRESVQKDFHQFVKEIVELIKNNYSTIEEVLKTSKHIDIDEDSNKRSEILRVINIIFKYSEEKPFQNIKNLRKELKSGINYLKKFYFKNKWSYLIEKYEKSVKRSVFNKYMRKKLIFSKVAQISMNSYLKKKRAEAKKKNKMKNFYKLFFKPVKKNYEIMKLEYNISPKENKFIQILENIENKKFRKNFLNFFIDKLGNMDMDYDPLLYSNHFLTNDEFIYFFVILENYINWIPQLRQDFLEILLQKNQEGKIARNMLKQCWRGYYQLYFIVLFKTFPDQDWKEYWTKFGIVSHFFENLGGANNFGFKKFINSPQAEGSISYFLKKTDSSKYNIFYELYLLIETTSKYTNAWVNTNSKILPSDNSDIFFILKRLMDHITVYIKGSSSINRLKIYNYRLDIWTGIIKRIVDDTNSDFYQVKMSCLIYISTFLEEFDKEIIISMGKNFLIDELFEIAIRLFKKLFVRLQKKIYLKENNYNIVKKHEENSIPIKSAPILEKYYGLHKKDFSEHVLLKIVIEIFFIINYLSLKIHTFKFFINDKEELIKKQNKLSPILKQEIFIFVFIKRIVMSIEVIFEKNNEERKLKKVFFKKQAKCFLLSNETKNKCLLEIDYMSSNYNKKHTDFFNLWKMFNTEMKYNKKLFEKYINYYIFVSQDTFRKHQLYLYLLSILRNILSLFALEGKHITSQFDTNLPGYYFNNFSLEVIIIFLAYFTLLYSGGLCVVWIITQYKYELKINLLILKQNKKNNLGVLKKFYINYFSSLLFHPRFSSFCWHCIFTILGLTINRFFFTLNLFMITNLSRTINYVMKSIIKHYGKLIIAFFLSVLLILIYSFLYLVYFQQDKSFSDDICRNYFICFINALNRGLILGGGMSEMLHYIPNPNESKSLYWSRIFFDLSFYFFVKLICLNVISGIIIDTFAELRNKLTKTKYEEQFVCFICGQNKWQIEKAGENFKIHRKETHNVWKYLYFIIGLQKKKRNLNSQEYYINQKLKSDDFTWLPKDVFLKKTENLRDLPPQEN